MTALSARSPTRLRQRFRAGLVGPQGDVPGTRAIAATGLAVGGGSLVADRAIDVPLVGQGYAETVTGPSAAMDQYRTLQQHKALQRDLTPQMYSAKGDVRADYPVYTTTAGSALVSFLYANFGPADVGKLIELPFAGAAAQKLIATINAVNVAGNQVTLSTTSGTTLTGVNQRIRVGTDDTVAIQAMMTAATAGNYAWHIPVPLGSAGCYFITAPLYARAGPFANVLGLPPPRWSVADGASICAMAPMTHMIRYGDIDGDYSQYLRQPNIHGGVWDANVLADDCIQVPFALHGNQINVQVKNIVKTGWRLGSTSAPGPSARHALIMCDISRDSTRVPVTSITKANPAVVTTGQPHGFATGQGVYLPAISGMTQLANRTFDIAVLSATTFALRDVDSTAYGTFTSTAGAVKTMPSWRPAKAVSSITQANPGVVTTATPHYLTTGQKVLVSDLVGMGQAQGVFIATVTGANTFSIGVNTTGYAAYSSGGSAVEYLELTDQQVGVYDENHTDAETWGGAWQGVRVGRGANPATCGYDGKHFGTHVFNLEEGEVFTAFDLVGDNHLSGVQVDGPFKFAVRLRGLRNTADGCKVNYSPPLPVIDNYASMFFLDTGNGLLTSTGELNATKCGFKAGSSSFRLRSDASGNLAGFRGHGNYYVNCIGQLTPRQAWIDAQAGMVSIASSAGTVQSGAFNIASLVRNAAGDWTVNSNIAIPAESAGFAQAGSGVGGGDVWNATEYVASRTTFSRRYLFKYFSGGSWYSADPPSFAVAVKGS